MSGKQVGQPSFDRSTSSPPSPTMPYQKRALVNSDKSNFEEELSIKLRLVIEENKLLKDTLHLNNVALQKQINYLTLWHGDVIEVHHTNLHHFQETKAKKEAHMDETNSLRNELITARNKNKDLQKTIEQLKAALGAVRNNVPAYYPIQLNSTLQNELDHEKEKNKALEQRTAELEAKWGSKQEELRSIIGVMNRKLESCERERRSLEKEVNKIAFQKRGLEKKLLSLQGPERALVCHSIDWSMDANLWTQTNEFFDKSLPMLTLCAGETVESLTMQLKAEKQYLARAKDLLAQHQDQLTKLITALNKPYCCRPMVSSNMIEANVDGETIDTMTQKIKTLQELIVSKDYEITQLKSRKLALETDNEKLGILKSQVMVYQADFLTERKTRETITSERDRLITELQLAREEYRVLAAHLAKQGLTAPSLGGTRLSIRSERKIQIPPPHVPITTVSIPDVSPGTSEPLLMCPNPDCKMRFTSLDKLQYHVHQCLQLSD